MIRVDSRPRGNGAYVDSRYRGDDTCAPVRRFPVAWVGAALLLAWPVAVLAHGFAVRYDLPLPLGFFLAGAGATVALSFVVLVLFARANPVPANRVPPQFASVRIGRVIGDPRVTCTLQAISAVLFLALVAVAAFGTLDPFKNISTTFVWVIWWVGMMFVNTFVGDIWAVLNPWNALFSGTERMLAFFRPGARLSLERAYPEWLGIWPAVALYLVFAWIELIWNEAQAPRPLACVVIGYSLVTWVGMSFFGRSAWLAHGEVFAVVFSTFARFAPFSLRANHSGPLVHPTLERRGTIPEPTLVLRVPGTGLLVREPVSVSLAAMVLALLATVTFDGFLATPAWTAIHDAMQALTDPRPWLASVVNYYTVTTALLLLFPVAFGAAFLGCCRLTAALGGRAVPTATVAGHFVLTLLPIAIAYHFAHYVVYLLIAGQYIIPALSDPFALGWDLIGTASYKPDIGIVGAKFAWYTGVIAIVTGHVIAVWLAHRTALDLFHDRRKLLASQLPMLALMVAYTMTSLWIIAQPAVH